MSSDKVIQYLSESGFGTPYAQMRSEILTWKSWYTLQNNDFHRINFYNGRTNVKRNMYSLGMTKTVCEDWANLLMNEKTIVSLDTEEKTARLKEILNKNDFFVNANRLCEIAFALGTGAFVECVLDGEIRIDYVRAENIFPLEWDNKGIIDCAFASSVTAGDDEFIMLQIHRRKPDGTYTISNRIILVSGDSYKEMELPDNIISDFETQTATPFFQIIMPNIVNNYDLDSPMGISIFGNALDVLKEIDLIYDSFKIEIETGRRMVFLSSELFYPDENGIIRNAIQDGETIFRYVRMEQEMIHDYTPSLRFSEIKDGLQFQLNLLSEKCGMGTNRYEFSRSGLKTATEVISEDSDLFQSLKKHEIILESALRGLVQALIMLDPSLGSSEIVIKFDDSIIVDAEQQRRNWLEEVSAGLMSKEEFRQRQYGENEEEARARVADSFPNSVEDIEI